jgi:2-methylcitrate dehydratase PrpD
MSSVALASPAAVASKVTQQLVERALAVRRDTLPADVAELAKQCVLDCLGVAIAGAREPVVNLLLDEAREDGARACATAIVHGTPLGAPQAALVNGTASHALDYDDVNLSITGHPSTVILPALLAAAEKKGAVGAELMAAFVAGYELACRVGVLVGPGHYDRGFHATATVGAFGAAIACAHLLGLDAARAGHAMGIAGTQAAGLKAMFGTHCKPFHAGLAAQSGLRAATLAQRGMESRADVLECRQGFAATHSDDYHPDLALGDAARYYIRANLFKYHASCYGTHSAIECARRLRAERGLGVRDVKAVTVRVEKVADGICNIAQPGSGLEAKFSLRFCVAAALAGRDTGDMSCYTDAATTDADYLALRERIKVEFVPAWPLMKAGVTVELANGERIATEHDAGEPATDVAAQDVRLRAKFTTLTAPVLGAARSAQLLAAVDDLDRVRVAELMRLCVPA